MSSGRDVRMRGFASRSLVREACAWIDQNSEFEIQVEDIPVSQCSGRILAGNVHAPISVPEFHRSAMDGYALLGAETSGAGDYNPLPFRIIGDAFPGRPCLKLISPGTAVRIMTGAPLPDGADAVLPVEFAQEAENGAIVEAMAAVAPGKNVGRRGEDIAADSVLLEAGRKLRPQDAAVLASVGFSRVSVVQRPSVLILATGNELVAPGETREPFQIFDANTTLLQCLVQRDGAGLIDTRWLRDESSLLRQALFESKANVILISGGSSVGAEDNAPQLVRELGELAIHGIAMRPSSPAGMGKIGRSLVFLLPGNPVSCLCAYDFFARRAIRRIGKQSSDWPYPQRKAKLSRKLVSAVGRLDYVRVRFVNDRLEPLAISGASVLSSTVRADGFVIIPEDLEGYAEETEVEVFLYDPL